VLPASTLAWAWILSFGMKWAVDVDVVVVVVVVVVVRD
jgi:hypothetical protein